MASALKNLRFVARKCSSSWKEIQGKVDRAGEGTQFAAGFVIRAIPLWLGYRVGGVLIGDPVSVIEEIRQKRLREIYGESVESGVRERILSSLSRLSAEMQR